MKISNETKIGLLAAVSISLLIFGYNFLKGENLFTSTNTYYAKYKNVDGLFRSNPVQINGHSIGSVSSVSMDYATQVITVAVTVPQEISVPKNSVLKIINTDIAGSKGLELILGHDSTGIAISGDTLLSDQDIGLLAGAAKILTPLAVQVENLISDIDTAVSGVNLNTTLVELSKTLKSFKMAADKLGRLMDDSKTKIDATISNLHAISKDLKASSPNINTIVSRIDSVTLELKKLKLEGLDTEVFATLEGIKTTVSNINNGEGSLAKLMNDAELYNKLKDASLSIDSLAKDIQRYPRRYFGLREKIIQKGDKQKEYNEGVKLPTKTSD